MITITTAQGVLKLPAVLPDDRLTISGLCGHGVSVFEPCGDCIVIEELERLYNLKGE